MASSRAATPSPSGPPMLGWTRVFATLAVVAGVFVLALAGWTGGKPVLALRLLVVGAVLLLVFAVLERRPRRLPGFLPRWALQIAGVAMAVPFALVLAYVLTAHGYAVPFWKDGQRQAGFAMLLALCLLVAPWAAGAALLRQITGQARTQALAFELERTQLERSAMQARLGLLQAQVEPHFLFNTLANIRELVDSGSPRASEVLGSMIAYLRAAVPRLNEATSTVGQELELVRAYLEVMQMRMPDRLDFAIVADDVVRATPCPAMAVLTLVENAVRHGIDPAEDGGQIAIEARIEAGRLRITVRDTGVGLREGEGGLGTGLANLRERLHLLHGEAAVLRLSPLPPRGVLASLELPAGPGA